jgi:hypothetical protein
LGFDFFHPALKDRLLPGYYHSDGYHTEFVENISLGIAVSGLLIAKHGPETGVEGLALQCRVLGEAIGHAVDGQCVVDVGVEGHGSLFSYPSRLQ